jgi:hypothetical protein
MNCLCWVFSGQSLLVVGYLNSWYLGDAFPSLNNLSFMLACCGNVRDCISLF